MKKMGRHLLDAIVKQRRFGAYTLYVFARRIIFAYENQDVDMATNGERWLLTRLKGSQNVTAIDVGANQGEWANQLLANCPEARLICFEPVPETFAELRRNVTGTHVLLVNMALSSSQENITIHAVPENPYLASAYGTQLYASELKTEAIELSTTTGDDQAKENGVNHINILKVDAEGHDFDVIKGFKSKIEAGSIDFIQFEYNIFTLAAGRSLNNFFELLTPAYVLCRLLPKGLEVCGYHHSLDNFGQSNWVAIRRGLFNDEFVEKFAVFPAKGLSALALRQERKSDLELLKVLKC